MFERIENFEIWENENADADMHMQSESSDAVGSLFD